jgi:hypothetical protein
VQKLGVNKYACTVEIDVLSGARFESFAAYILYKFWVSPSEWVSIGAIRNGTSFHAIPALSSFSGRTVGFRKIRKKREKPRIFPGLLH